MATKKTASWSDDPERTAKNAAHADGMEKPPQPAAGGPVLGINLPPLDIRTLTLRIVGDSPLICHRWSDKARKEMLDKQMGKATAGREKKDPERDFWESLYHLDPSQKFPHKEGYRYGFPAIGFKNAAVTACTSLGKAITKVAARQAFHVCGELVEIHGAPEMREDMVRVGQGTADIRFRGMFPEWFVQLLVKYNARLLTAEQVVNLFNTAGFAVGVGEWRTEKDGNSGQFHVE